MLHPATELMYSTETQGVSVLQIAHAVADSYFEANWEGNHETLTIFVRHFSNYIVSFLMTN